MPTKQDFVQEIKALLINATQLGFQEVTINAGNLHRRVGDYPGTTNHRMPSCCDAMRECARQGDCELPNSLKRNGASFAIRYKLGE